MQHKLALNQVAGGFYVVRSVEIRWVYTCRLVAIVVALQTVALTCALD